MAAEPMGERMTRVETRLDGLKDGQAQIVSRLDAHDHATADLSVKLDTILANQSANAEALKTKLESITTDIAAMKPHTDTVADFKKYSRWGKATIITGIGAIGMVISAKAWLIANWNWFWK